MDGFTQYQLVRVVVKEREILISPNFRCFIEQTKGEGYIITKLDLTPHPEASQH